MDRGRVPVPHSDPKHQAGKQIYLYSRFPGCSAAANRLALPNPPHPIIPRLILSLAAEIPAPFISEDFKIRGVPMAAAEVVLTNFLLVNDELFSMILIVLVFMIGIPTFH